MREDIDNNTPVLCVQNGNEYYFVAEVDTPVSDWTESVNADQCDGCGNWNFVLDRAKKAYVCSDQEIDGEMCSGCGDELRVVMARAGEVVF